MELVDLRNGLVTGYERYVSSKVGDKAAQGADGFTRFGYLQNACNAARKLAKQYDCGITLARGGLWLGYIFELLEGFDVYTVTMKRQGFGALWMPTEKFSLKGKRVIVFDNDVVTGRTLRKAVRELKKMGPATIDLLLVYGHTELSPLNYDKWKRFLKPEHEVLGENLGDICVDTMCQIPSDFGRVMSLEKTFLPIDKEIAIQRLSEALQHTTN